MSVAIVSGQISTTNLLTSPQSTALTVALTGVTAGNTLVMAVVCDTGTTTIKSVTDSGTTNGWTFICGQTAGVRDVEWWYASGAAAGTHTVSVTPNASCEFGMTLFELSGAGIPTNVGSGGGEVDTATSGNVGYLAMTVGSAGSWVAVASVSYLQTNSTGLGTFYAGPTSGGLQLAGITYGPASSDTSAATGWTATSGVWATAGIVVPPAATVVTGAATAAAVTSVLVSSVGTVLGVAAPATVANVSVGGTLTNLGVANPQAVASVGALPGAFSNVQSVSTAIGSGSGTQSITVSKPAFMQLLIAVCLVVQSSASDPSIVAPTDNGSGGWTALGAEQRLGSTNQWARAFYKVATSTDHTSLTSITFTWSNGTATTGGVVLFEEFDGFTGMPTVELGPVATSGNSTNNPEIIFNEANTVEPLLVWSVVATSGPNGGITGSNFFQIYNGSTFSNYRLLYTQGSASTCESSWTICSGLGQTYYGIEPAVNFEWTTPQSWAGFSIAFYDPGGWSGAATASATVGVSVGGVATELGTITATATTAVSCAGGAGPPGTVTAVVVASASVGGVVTQFAPITGGGIVFTAIPGLAIPGLAVPGDTGGQAGSAVTAAAAASVSVGGTILAITGAATPQAVTSVSASGIVTQLGSVTVAVQASVTANSVVTQLDSVIAASTASMTTSGVVTALGTATAAVIGSASVSGIATGAVSAEADSTISVTTASVTTVLEATTPAAQTSVSTSAVLTQFGAANSDATANVSTLSIVTTLGTATAASTVSVSTTGLVETLAVATASSTASATTSGVTTSSAASPMAIASVAVSGLLRTLGVATATAVVSIFALGGVPVFPIEDTIVTSVSLSLNSPGVTLAPMTACVELSQNEVGANV